MKILFFLLTTIMFSVSIQAEIRQLNFSVTAKVKTGIKLTEHVYLSLNENCEGYIFQVKSKENPITIKNERFTPYQFELDKTQTIRCRGKKVEKTLTFQIDSETVSVKNPFFES